MGFFDSLTGKQSTTVPASGFYQLPKVYQNMYLDLLHQAKGTLLPGGKLDTEAFTPLPETADETRAFDMMRQGFAPTEESLRSDVAMQMNPYVDFVIDEINRQ